MNALCDIAITNRDPRWAGIMAQIESDDDPRADFLAWQRREYVRLAQLFVVERFEEFEQFSWQMYAKAKEESCAS